MDFPLPIALVLNLSLVVCLSGDLGRKTVNGCVSLLRQLGISARQYMQSNRINRIFLVLSCKTLRLSWLLEQ